MAEKSPPPDARSDTSPEALEGRFASLVWRLPSRFSIFGGSGPSSSTTAGSRFGTGRAGQCSQVKHQMLWAMFWVQTLNSAVARAGSG
jgi:hypothetical protein